MAERRRTYGKKHVLLRKQLAQLVASGGAVCARCGLPIGPLNEPCYRCGRTLCGANTNWDVDHSDDPHDWDGREERPYLDGPTGPVSHSCCNRRAGGSHGGKATARKTRIRAWSRQWLPDDPEPPPRRPRKPFYHGKNPYQDDRDLLD